MKRPSHRQGSTAEPARRVRELLEEDLHPHWRRVEGDRLDRLCDRIARDPEADGLRAASVASVVARVVADEVRRTCDELSDLQDRRTTFIARHATLVSEAERRDHLLAVAEELGASRSGLRGDRRALRRWFGQDAVDARFRRRLGEREHDLVFLLERLGSVGRRCLRASAAGGEGDDSRGARRAWEALGVERLAVPLLEADLDPRVVAAAFRCLARALGGIVEAWRADVVGVPATRAVYRSALDRSGDAWVQSEALALLGVIDRDAFSTIVRRRFDEPGGGDDLFVRRRLAGLIAPVAELADVLAGVVARDPSPFVRQGVAEALAEVVDDARVRELAWSLACADAEPSVRAAGLLAIRALVDSGRSADGLGDIVAAVMAEEPDPFVLRVAMTVASEVHARLPRTARSRWRAVMLPALRRLFSSHPELSVRRWAAQARERLWCDAVAGRRALLARLRQAARATGPGDVVRLRDRSMERLDETEFGRVLSVAAQDDFGFDVRRTRRGFEVVRGHRFGTRLWRILHEFHHPSPDKRQGFRHTIGRVFEGGLRVPSAILSEMSMTKVPGEPFTLADEGGWRPYLPLVDELISAIDENSPVSPLRIVTSEGVTTIVPPSSPGRRTAARLGLIRRFARFARLRNAERPGSYVDAVRELGFRLEFRPHEGEEAAPDVDACYRNAVAALMPALPGAVDWTGIRDYFYSVYENTLGQLLVFLAASGALLVGRHIHANRVFARSRRRIPLVIGGWGTRGKSGTERIKAALCNALGHRLVAKTTGCEAMFLYSDTFGELHELMLFRPYDKATIWEQTDVVNLAARLGSRVFLWECMGLTPHYVEILQRQWMKDDLSTIVNTYPDHEDLQGPAGINIPEVMTCFMRQGGHLVTSEQQMTPILDAAAHRLDSRIDKVGWLEPGLLTPDVLARFPYAEHPNNIALVVEMGRQLGIPADFSLKEMADRVVPDLGVLKVYPTAEIDGRRIQFVNGCSANERFGALGNWKRVGFDRHDPREDPGTLVSALVNNRADRIARSRVFASILAEDIAFDRLFLVGSNLDGMLGYIREAVAEHLAGTTLFTGDGRAPAQVFLDLVRRWRLPATEADLARLRDAVAVAVAPGPDADGGSGDAGWLESWASALAECRAFAGRLEGIPEATDGMADLDAGMRALLARWFERKIVVVRDFHASGDQIVATIAEHTPAGFTHRVMGMQNIKGTGLDFVYRWQAWDACHRACQALRDADPDVVRTGVAGLADFREFGLLCEREVESAIDESIAAHGTRDPVLRRQLEQIRDRMRQELAAVRKGIGDAREAAGLGRRALDAAAGFCEQLVDSLDAIRRRWTANQVYADLAAERISPKRAAHEIHKLNKRQKGGWLRFGTAIPSRVRAPVPSARDS